MTLEAVSITTDGTTIATNLTSDFYLTSTNTFFVQNDTTNKIQATIANYSSFPSAVKVGDAGSFLYRNCLRLQCGRWVYPMMW